MGLLDRVGRPRKYVVPAIRQNHQIVLLREPEANTLLAVALISPYFYRRIGVMFDDRTRPAYAFAPPEIRRPILLDRPLLDHVPKGCFLAVSDRQAFEAKPPPLKLRLRPNSGLTLSATYGKAVPCQHAVCTKPFTLSAANFQSPSPCSLIRR